MTKYVGHLTYLVIWSHLNQATLAVTLHPDLIVFSGLGILILE